MLRKDEYDIYIQDDTIDSRNLTKVQKEQSSLMSNEFWEDIKAKRELS
jgi:hypothetical protein